LLKSQRRKNQTGERAEQPEDKISYEVYEVRKLVHARQVHAETEVSGK